MAYKIAGGSRWWQVRAGGLEAEWIAMKRDYEPALKEEKERMKARRRSAREKMKSGTLGKGSKGDAEYGDGEKHGQADTAEDAEEDDGCESLP